MLMLLIILFSFVSRDHPTHTIIFSVAVAPEYEYAILLKETNCSVVCILFFLKRAREKEKF